LNDAHLALCCYFPPRYFNASVLLLPPHSLAELKVKRIRHLGNDPQATIRPCGFERSTPCVILLFFCFALSTRLTFAAADEDETGWALGQPPASNYPSLRFKEKYTP